MRSEDGNPSKMVKVQRISTLSNRQQEACCGLRKQHAMVIMFPGLQSAFTHIPINRFLNFQQINYEWVWRKLQGEERFHQSGTWFQSSKTRVWALALNCLDLQLGSTAFQVSEPGWARFLTSPCLSFLTCKMGIIIASTSLSYCKG